MAGVKRPRGLKRVKEPYQPVECYDTIRQHLMSALEYETLSARDLSRYAHITEKEVCDHLEHIRKTLSKNKRRLTIVPAQCERCGFIYAKRARLAKPGKCPACHNSLIHAPLFHIDIKEP